MRFLVISPTVAGNAVGRALSLAEVLRLIGPVTIAGADDGPLWSGIGDSRFSVRPFRSRARLATLLDEESRGTDGPLAVVAVKPLRKSLGWAVDATARWRARPLLVADIDDPDAELSRERLAARPLKHLKLTPLDDRHPWRSDRVLRAALPRVDVLSVSSWALRDALPTFSGPVAHVPHARPPAPYIPPTPSARLRLGFLGTPRAHKGLGVLLDILEARDDTELHLLEGTPLPRCARSAGVRSRIVFHPHSGPETLARAYRHVDVVVIPQDPDSAAAALQLPAKLVDALRFGRPVVATATPAIREIAQDAFLPVTRWSPLDEALGHLARLADRATCRAIGRRGEAYFRENLSADVVARGLRRVLERVAPGPDAVDRRRAAGVGR